MTDKTHPRSKRYGRLVIYDKPPTGADSLLCEGLSELSMFLIVVKGMHRKIGKMKPCWKHRKPSLFSTLLKQPKSRVFLSFMAGCYFNGK